MGAWANPRSARLLRRGLSAALAGVSLGFAIFVTTSDGLRSSDGGRLGGDLPPFYAAAQIVRAGEARSLYDFDVQQRQQAGLFPDDPGAWLPFPYPPFVAAAYVPLTLASFKTAYVLHTIGMTLLCVLALLLLRTHLPPLDRHFAACAAATLTFYPLLRANLGGQNSAVSLLCAAGAAASLASKRELAAGVWLGAWLFKPQLALPVIVLVALAGYWRSLIGVALVAVIYYLIGAAVMGLDWPARWVLDGLLPYAPVNLQMDRINGVSFREVASEWGAPLVGWVMVALAAALVIRNAWRARQQPLAYVGMVAAAAVLLAPHGLYYDGGLAVLGLAVGAAITGAASMPYLGAAWILGGLQHLRAYLPLPPVTALLIGLLVWLDRLQEGIRDQGSGIPDPFTRNA
jgi:hypothetical protein